MAEWFAMGGYGAYIWPAYAIAAAVLVALGWTSFATYRKRRRMLDELKESDKGRRA